MVYLPPEKNQNRNKFVFLSFGADPLKWRSFIEIGEMACSTTALVDTLLRTKRASWALLHKKNSLPGRRKIKPDTKAAVIFVYTFFFNSQTLKVPRVIACIGTQPILAPKKAISSHLKTL